MRIQPASLIVVVLLCSYLRYRVIDDEKHHPRQSNPSRPVAQANGQRVACSQRRIGDNNLTTAVTTGCDRRRDDPPVGVNDDRIVAAVICLNQADPMLDSAKDQMGVVLGRDLRPIVRRHQDQLCPMARNSARGVGEIQIVADNRANAAQRCLIDRICAARWATLASEGQGMVFAIHAQKLTIRRKHGSLVPPDPLGDRRKITEDQISIGLSSQAAEFGGVRHLRVARDGYFWPDHDARSRLPA